MSLQNLRRVSSQEYASCSGPSQTWAKALDIHSYFCIVCGGDQQGYLCKESRNLFPSVILPKCNVLLSISYLGVWANSCKYSKHPWFQKLLLQLCFPSIILETEDINARILPVPKLQDMKASLEKNIGRYLFPPLSSSFQAESIHGEWQETK